MRKAVKLYALLGVLVAVCVVAFVISRHEEKKEQIKNSGEVILEIPRDSVTGLSWENEDGSFSFTKEEGWLYDEDGAFPVDADKIDTLLEQFEAFSAAFVIEEAEDLSQYGLDEPVCTIRLTAGEETYTIELGDFSKMDEQRYVSIGDGNAYLMTHDPLEEYDAVLSDLILDDAIPDFDTAESIEFTGDESYSIVRDEEGESVCGEDIYFADGQPLDTDRVESYLEDIQSLKLSEYVSYNVTQEELNAFGLDEPDLTVTLTYSGEENTESFVLHLGSNREEQSAYDEALADEEASLPTVTRYARVGQSQIVYQISSSSYLSLMAASFDDLRHQNLFTASFDEVVGIEAELDGEKHTFTLQTDEEDEGQWSFGEADIDISGIQSALEDVQANDFTDTEPMQKEELRLTITLNNETFPSLTLAFYRYDGESCIAELDGEVVAFVPRSQVVELIEALNEVILAS